MKLLKVYTEYFQDILKKIAGGIFTLPVLINIRSFNIWGKEGSKTLFLAATRL